ncbi:hypothetical protein BST81_12945 [Leptolyngbya sp. 'hensonii']|uniref:histidine kinase dimerization/phosphoacceptor domain -containing protein n=1 Tax=Leptolyngbya sp. 'hensonii' TaxID=1922337 RepID=UPI0009500E19|nr:histidine kinase dimerization/phosphoacceptor domain -containing protein [Leptolyngbya sp. 'hensonii']OLP17954.1 hypothetical protein BST81_12945 [Leptolyngbya sp. 'hensonii']
MAQFQVRANLIVPILQGHSQDQQLWGLLIVQHCEQPRSWLSWEIELLQKLTIQVGFAVQQSQLYGQLQVELSQREYTLRELQQAKEELQSSLQEKEILLKEIHHRVKNDLLVVSSLLEWQTDYIEDQRLIKMIGESQNRIQSMALIHEKLYQSQNLAQIDLGEYLATLMNQLLFSSSMNFERIQVHTDLDSIWLNIEMVMPCGLIVSELVSNVFEHAFPGQRTGHLWLSAKGTNRHITVVVRDDGIGCPDNFDAHTTESMGFQLICLLTQQLEGNIELFQDSGTTIELTFSELHYQQRV